MFLLFFYYFLRFFADARPKRYSQEYLTGKSLRKHTLGLYSSIGAVLVTHPSIIVALGRVFTGLEAVSTDPGARVLKGCGQIYDGPLLP